ncbi:UNVERIFIED_CONTAM: hypothetical protein GTU68_007057 [Idotea baltica]|nr:hypothetical protein [Idotea baltica]
MSTPFREYKGLDLSKVADETQQFWEENDIFQKSITSRNTNKPFVFYEGPPSANGLPGIHHVMARTIKDIFCRYKTLQGFQVKRKAGWDTHGLPIELGVEKELGITKEDIGKKISVEDYNEACKKAVMRYTDVWEELTRKMGHWVDMNDPYVTYKPKYIESVWWLLKQIYNKDLLYKGYTIQPYSPKAGTGLSSHELNQPGTYQDVELESLPDALKAFDNLYMLAWTTTPWTLPSNTALTVGNKIDYVFVSTFNQYTFEPITVILAKKLVAKQFTECKGSDLIGVKYEQLLQYTLPYQNPENAFRVIAGDFVTTEDGTGIVHTAPTFGADDAVVAKQAKPEIPPMLVLDENGNPVPLVDLQGKFRPEMDEFAGKYLKEENKAFKVEKYKHSYPNCWRTDKPILYYPLDSWFIKVSDKKDRMYELNQDINWKPKSTGEGRFGNWLKNANDWNLSRSRFWGIPLPIWRTEDGKEELIIGSVEELKSEMKKSVEDLHKNIVDKVTLVSESGKAMKRESDLIDVWFDSGSMPYAQWHYPFENKELIDKNKFYPADFIAEGVDQTRGWFYTLHAIGTLVFDSNAYKNVVSNGLVLDKEGKKMSKRLGNAVDPFRDNEKKHGADANALVMISNANTMGQSEI